VHTPVAAATPHPRSFAWGHLFSQGLKATNNFRYWQGQQDLQLCQLWVVATMPVWLP